MQGGGGGGGGGIIVKLCLLKSITQFIYPN